MKIRKKIIVSTIALALAVQFSVLTAKGPIDQQQIDRAMPMVVKASDGLFVDVPFTANLVTMNVRVYNSQNELVFSERSSGELIGLLSGDLADGEYRYEAVTVFQLDAPVGHGPSYSDEGISRDFGGFTVGDGLILDGSQSMQQNMTETLDDASLLDQVLEKSMHLAGLTLDFIIPSAQAVDHSISSGIPSVFFNDTDITAQTNEWVLRAFQGSPEFQLVDLVNSNTVLEFDTSINNARSMFVDASGDVHFANGTLNLDKSLQNMAIGWSDTANGNLSISDVKPHVWFHDETDTAEADWQLDGATVKFWSRPTDVGAWRVPLNFNVNAPGNSLSFNSSGDAGFGTANPSASVHLTRNNKTAQLKIADTSGTIGNLNLLQLENTGGAQIGFRDTTRSYQWNFIGGRDFKINATTFLGTEFVVTREGNLNILGVLSENSDVNAKEKIVPIDRQDVLSKIASLPISEWSYIDTPQERHIGPMAQDFHAAFGLGHTDTLIATLDTAGVALAGIQALLEEYNLLKKENIALLEIMESQAARLEQVEVQQGMLQSVIAELYEDKAVRTLTNNTISN